MGDTARVPRARTQPTVHGDSRTGPDTNDNNLSGVTLPGIFPTTPRAQHDTYRVLQLLFLPSRATGASSFFPSSFRSFPSFLPSSRASSCLLTRPDFSFRAEQLPKQITCAPNAGPCLGSEFREVDRCT